MKIEKDLFFRIAQAWKSERFPEPVIDAMIMHTLGIERYADIGSQLIIYGDDRSAKRDHPHKIELCVGELVAFTQGVVALYTRKDQQFQQYAGMMEAARGERGRCIVRSFFGEQRRLSIHPTHFASGISIAHIKWGLVTLTGSFSEEGRVNVHSHRYSHMDLWFDCWLPVE